MRADAIMTPAQRRLWLLRHRIRAAVPESVWRDPYFVSMLPDVPAVRAHGRVPGYVRDERERVRAQGGRQ